MPLFTPACPAFFCTKLVCVCEGVCYGQFRCRWVKYYIKASLMFHLSHFFSVSVSKLKRAAFYSRFNGSMCIITLAPPLHITNLTMAASKTCLLTVISHSIFASTQDQRTFWSLVKKKIVEGVKSFRARSSQGSTYNPLQLKFLYKNFDYISLAFSLMPHAVRLFNI